MLTVQELRDPNKNWLNCIFILLQTVFWGRFFLWDQLVCSVMGKINCKLVSFNFLSKKLHSAHSSKKYLPDNILAFSEFLSHFLCFYLYFVLYISVLRMFRITPPPQKKREEKWSSCFWWWCSLSILFLLHWQSFKPGPQTNRATMHQPAQAGFSFVVEE